MKSIYTVGILCITLITVVTVFASCTAATQEVHPVPAPPAGYEYCVTADGRGVYFCPVD